jgi:hypothetical protein
MVAVAGGPLYSTDSAAVAADGTVWTWADPATPPTAVAGLDGVVAVAMGPEGDLALRADGTVWSWGPFGEPAEVPAPAAAGTPTP